MNSIDFLIAGQQLVNDYLAMAAMHKYERFILVSQR
jgi:hypothetical protein